MDIPLERLRLSDKSPKEKENNESINSPSLYTRPPTLVRSQNYRRPFEIFVAFPEQEGQKLKKFLIELTEKESDCHTVISKIIKSINKYLKAKKFSFQLKDIPIYYELLQASKAGTPKKNTQAFDFKDNIWGTEKLTLKFHSDAFNYLPKELLKQQTQVDSSNDQLQSFLTNDSDKNIWGNGNNSNNLKHEYCKVQAHYTSMTFLSDKKSHSNASDTTQFLLDPTKTSTISNDSEYNNLQSGNQLRQVEGKKVKSHQPVKSKGFFSNFFCCSNY